MFTTVIVICEKASFLLPEKLQNKLSSTHEAKSDITAISVWTSANVKSAN